MGRPGEHRRIGLTDDRAAIRFGARDGEPLAGPADRLRTS